MEAKKILKYVIGGIIILPLVLKGFCSDIKDYYSQRQYYKCCRKK